MFLDRYQALQEPERFVPSQRGRKLSHWLQCNVPFLRLTDQHTWLTFDSAPIVHFQGNEYLEPFQCFFFLPEWHHELLPAVADRRVAVGNDPKIVP